MKQMMIDNESLLIKGVKNGSDSSFRILYNYWVSKLYSYVFRYVKSEAVTDDIVQETFLRVWNYRERLNPEQSFKAYLFTISYHLLLKELRHQINHPLMEQFMIYQYDEQKTSNEGEYIVDFEHFCLALEKAKQKLTPRQREIFEMNKELNISVSDIAKELSITEQVVRNQLTAALKVIRPELKHCFNLLVLFILDF